MAKPDLQELRLMWEALASNPQEAFMILPKEALIASVRDLAKDLLEFTDPNYIKEIDRNARAYGFEIGRGQSPKDGQVDISPDNPFINNRDV